MKKKVIIITGPTGVGKTKLSIELAKKYGLDVISADSCQVYKGFDIGTAKITEEEKQGVKHYLIDNRDPSDEYSAGDFARDAEAAINQIYNQDKFPLIVGGTGLYINSLLFPLTASADRDEEYRKKLEEIVKQEGKEKLYSMLQEIDPKATECININQVDRVIRALEIYHVSGVKKSELKPTIESNYEYLLLVLVRDREEVYDMINKRVDIMFNQGFVSEVQKLLNSGVSSTTPAMKSIGYREVLSYLNGEISLDEAKEIIKQKSRNYAKRQITYFKKMKGAEFINYTETKLIENKVKDFLGV